jgi:hypothetical protein
MKGMQKISRGSGFRGALDYCDKGGEKIGGNMLGMTPRELSTEFGLSRNQKDCKRPVWHSSLRLPKGDTLTREKWNEVAHLYMSRIGFDPDHQFAVFLHDDSRGQHIHVVASRISLSGKLYYGQNENLISTKIIHELEKRFSLTPTKKPEIDPKTNLPTTRSDKKRRNPRKPEIAKACRTLIKPPRAELSDIIDKCISADKPKTPESLKTALAARGVETVFFVEDEKIKGVTFHMNGLKFSGSALGPDYKFSRIMGRMKEQQNDKTRPDKKPAQRRRDEPDHPNPARPQPPDSSFDKKGLIARSGRRATETENRDFQHFQLQIEKGRIMENEKQSMVGALSHDRSTKAEDKDNTDHGWNEYTDHAGRVWFYDIGQPPRQGNRAGYSWDPDGGKDGPPAIRVWDCAVERHGVEQAAIDAVRICVFKSLPEPLRLHGTDEFQKYAAREMHRLGIGLQNTDGPGREEYDRLTREKEKGTQDQINAISAGFAQIDHQAKATHRAAAEQEDTPAKKDDDRSMRMGGPR